MAKHKYTFKAEHAFFGLVALFIIAFATSFFKTAGEDLGRNEANKLFR